MKQKNFALLLGYLVNQLKVIGRLLADIRSIDPQSKEKTSHLGYQLHNLYGALEDLFQEIARTFENRVEDPSRYHRELLKRMALEIPGIRPALLSAESHSLLNELRGFRHVFRHAYDYELSPNRLRELKIKLLENWSRVEIDLMAFQSFLLSSMETSEPK